MRRRHRREDLERLLAQRDEEHLTFNELSARSGIPVPTLSYWSAKLRREAEERDPSFAPVDLVEDEAPPTIVVELRPTVRILVERNFNASLLRDVVAALDPPC